MTSLQEGEKGVGSGRKQFINHADP
jgi:hypothetical protein